MQSEELSAEQPGPAGPNRTAADEAQRRRIAWLLFGFLLSVYLLTGKGFSEILDAEGYYLIAKAMVEDGSVGIKTELSSAVLHGTELTREGRTFLHFGIGYPLFITPFYVAGKLIGQGAIVVSGTLARFELFIPRAAVSTAPAIITALTGVVLYYLLLQLGVSLPASVAGGLMFGLATYAWPYAKIGFYEPFLALCQALALLWVVVYAATYRARWLALASLAAGWGIAAKPSLGLLLPVLIAYVSWAAWRGGKGLRLRRLAAAGVTLGAGLALWAGVILWYNAARTGDPTNVGYSPGNYMPSLNPQHLAEAMYGNTFSPGRGFFVFSPVALLFLLGIPWLWRRARAELIAMLALVLLNFGFFATRMNWATMRPWGPRYLEPLAPIFIALAVPGIVAVWRHGFGRRVIYGVVALSVCVQLLAISVPFGTWLDHVKQETGSSFSAVFNLKYSPLWGQTVVLRQTTLAPINAPASEIAFGEPSEAFKQELRKSPDFWFAYAYRLGLPKAPILLGVFALLCVAAWFGVRLWSGVRRAPAPPADGGLGSGTSPEGRRGEDSNRPDLSIWWVLAGGCILAVLFRLPGFGAPFWRDELFTVWFCRYPAPELPGALAWHTTHPPLYYLLLQAWLGLVGDSDANARLLSLLVGVGVITTAFCLALRWWGRAAATTTLLLCATAPGLVHMSQEVRNQILVPLFLLLAVAALWAWWNDRRSRWLLCYGLASAAALYTHYLAAPALLAINLAFVVAVARDKALSAWGWLAANALVLLLMLPWLGGLMGQFEGLALSSTHRGGGGIAGAIVASAAYLAGEDPARSARVVLRTALSGAASDFLAVLGCLGLIISGLVWCRKARGQEWAWVAVVGAAGAAIIMGALHGLRGTYCNARYFPMFSPFLLLGVGFVVSRLGAAWRWIIVILLLGLQTLVATHCIRRAPIPWPQVASFLTENESGDVPVLSVRLPGAEALRRYGYPGATIDVPYELPGLETQRQRRIGAVPLEPQDAPRLDTVLHGRSRFWLITSTNEEIDVPFEQNAVLREYVDSRSWRLHERRAFGAAELRLFQRCHSDPEASR